MTKKGMGSHQKSIGDNQVWLTPKFILNALGPFDLDPCAAPEPRPWNTATKHIVEKEDGLSQKWEGRVWLNPPYDQNVIGKWVSKLAHHGKGTALIFARTETQFFMREVFEKAQSCLFLEGRLHFHTPEGFRAKHNGGAPSVLVAYGNDDSEILYESGLEGRFTPLTPLSCLFYVNRVMSVHMDESWKKVVLDTFLSETDT